MWHYGAERLIEVYAGNLEIHQSMYKGSQRDDIRTIWQSASFMIVVEEEQCGLTAKAGHA